jgi:diguanylate cyclase (GGDEF)-like protein/putative nucleotidyltransferase with HDIG domain
MSSPPRSLQLTDRRVARWALAGLAVVLSLLAALSLGGALRASAEAEDLKRSGDLAKAYLVALDAASREDTIEDVFKDDPDLPLADDFDRAARDLDGALARLARDGEPRDRALAARVAPLHAAYAEAMRDIFAAGARGDEDAVEAINDERADPAQDELQPLLSGKGPTYAATQLADIDRFARGERRALRLMLVLVPLGIAVYVVLLLVLGAHRRRHERQAREEVVRLQEALHTDSLTRLPNHRALHRDLDALAPGSHAVAVLDVAGLKEVNDHRGHLVGDEVLRAVADALAAAADGRAYRIGGDEFAVLLPGAGIADVMTALAAARSEVVVEHAAGVRAGAVAGDRAVTPGELLRRASVALVAARQLGRALVAYTADLEELVAGAAEPGAQGVRALSAALAQAVDAKDAYTRSHCETVSTVASLIAQELGVDADRIGRLRTAALLHDVGKIGIPEAILNKRGALDEAEWEVMRRHPAMGADIVAAAGLDEHARWVLHHHERWDGGGYPAGLAGEAIPLESRIILVADTVEAITADRPYRAARPMAEAVAELRRHSGTQFDPACVAAAERVLAGEDGLVSQRTAAAV